MNWSTVCGSQKERDTSSSKFVIFYSRFHFYSSFSALSNGRWRRKEGVIHSTTLFSFPFWLLTWDMMGSRRNKSGAPNLKDYESEAFVQKFDAIRHVLIQQLNDNTITNRALSLAIGSFLQFQEEHLGRDVSLLDSSEFWIMSFYCVKKIRRFFIFSTTSN